MLHEVDLENARYRSRVVEAIMQALNDGAPSLTAVCRRCRGAFPPIVRDLIESQVDHRPIPHRAWMDEDPGMFDSGLPAMPEPHPVDYEWRYAATTADTLANHLAQMGGRVGCLGTPTVFWRLRQAGINAVLFDRNQGLLQYLRKEDVERVRVYDLLDTAESGELTREAIGQFDSVLLDPPWYPDHMLVWIWKAIQLLRPGGNLILTLFPDLIRPTAFDERRQIISTLESLGTVTPLSFPARYTTPLYEHETLSAFGLADLGQWRSADLVSVTVSAHDLGQPALTPHERNWSKFQLGTQVVAVRTDLPQDSPSRELNFQPPEPDGSFLLKTVSARDPVRKNVSVWTSRNRALVATHGAARITPYLSRLVTGSTPRTALQSSEPADRPALELLTALIGW